jgi:hypothetical protein
VPNKQDWTPAALHPMNQKSFNSAHRAVIGGVHMASRVEGFLFI